MDGFFAMDYQGAPFLLFGQSHLTALALVLFLGSLIVFMRRTFTPAGRKIFRYLLCAVILTSEASWQLWHAINGTWNANAMLPLWLCSLTAWSMPLLLIRRSRIWFQFIFPLGFLGAWMALLQPDLMQYGFPHFRFLEYFLLHGALVIAFVVMIAVEGFRPDIRWFPRVLLAFNMYWLFCALINPLVGGNYLYTAGKLPTPSLLDYLGPWPWYLVWMEVLGILLCLICYLPFIKRPHEQRGNNV